MALFRRGEPKRERTIEDLRATTPAHYPELSLEEIVHLYRDALLSGGVRTGSSAVDRLRHEVELRCALTAQEQTREMIGLTHVIRRLTVVIAFLTSVLLVLGAVQAAPLLSDLFSCLG